MNGSKGITGIGYQNAYSLSRVLELLDEPAKAVSVVVEGTGKDIEDLVVRYGDGSEELVQVKTRGTANAAQGNWEPAEIMEVVRRLADAGGKRNVRALRFVATGSVSKPITTLKEACNILRAGGALSPAHAKAVSDMSSCLCADDKTTRDLMRRLWIDIPHESEAHFKTEAQFRLVKHHGVDSDDVDKVYGYLYERLLDLAKRDAPKERAIRRDDVLQWIGGKRWRDREELLKELAVTDPALTRSAEYAEERRRHFKGRRWVFERIENWLADEKGPRFLLIRGEPGIGKTAIAAQLTHEMPVAAKHYCVAGDTGTIDPSLFIRSIANQLAKIDGFADCILKERETKTERGVSFSDLVAMPLTRLRTDGYEKPILIVVDALDEAARRLPQETILDILAGIAGLPEQVRFVLTSRPDGKVEARFDQLNIPYLPIDAKSEDNLKDVREYINSRIAHSSTLRDRLRKEGVEEDRFARSVEKASAGNFLYLVMLLKEVEDGTRRADAAEELPTGLEGIFREYLTRRGLDRDRNAWRERYMPVMGTLAVAREPLTRKQVAGFAGLSAQAAGEVLDDLGPFLKPALSGNRLYQFYHQSLSDFVRDEEKAGAFLVDVEAVHKAIGRFYLSSCARKWADCDDYGLRHVAAHLREAGEREKLKVLLFDYGWIEAKLAKTDVNAVIADYDLVDGESELRLVQRALGMSSHILARERKALPSQLHGRLMSFDNEETPSVAAFLQGVIAAQSAPWLRCHTCTLRSAGDPLIRTIEGHEGVVTGVSVYENGAKAISASSDNTLRIWDLATGKQVGKPLEGHTSYVMAVSVYENGAKAISASDDNTLRIWDLATGREVGKPLEGHTNWVNAVSVYENGAKAISASDDNTLRIWDLATGKQVGKPLKGHTSAVTAVSVYDNGAKAISASDDATIRVWRIDAREVLSIFVADAPVTACAVTPDGRTIVAGDEAGRIHILRLEEPGRPKAAGAKSAKGVKGAKGDK